MTTQEKNEYYRQNMVIVQLGAFSENSKCEIKRCKKKAKHLVFLGEHTKLSTLYGNCCPHHLSLICNRANAEGLARAEKWINGKEKEELAHAKKLINQCL